MPIATSIYERTTVYDSNQDDQQRQRSGTVYDGNDPSHGQVDGQGFGVPQDEQRQRSGTLYEGNNPSAGVVDQQGYGIDQNDQQPQRSGRPLPPTPGDGLQAAWKGKFVSAYGGYGDENQGLIFKRTDGQNPGELRHFSPKETQQLRASNNDLIKESMTHGAQGNDVQVTFSVANGRQSLGVQELNNQRPGHGK